MAYVDASVLVAYYCPEPLSAAAQALIEEDGGPSISALTEVEFRSALGFKVWIGELDARVAQRVFARFRLDVEEHRYRLAPVGSKEYSLACDWIGSFSAPLRTVDALHLATAFSAGLELVTADKALAACAEHLGVACRLIQ
jgi:predicted nucleic acid-binding protein